MTPANVDAEDAPSTAWVVLGSSGQWSDWSQWVVCVCTTEQAAKDHVGRITAVMREHWARRPAPAEDESFNDFWDRGGDGLLHLWGEQIRELDAHADDSDYPNYTAVEAPLFDGAERVQLGA